MLRVLICYLQNLTTRIGEERGYLVGIGASLLFILELFSRIPRVMLWKARGNHKRLKEQPEIRLLTYQDRELVARIGVDVEEHRIDVAGFHDHMTQSHYPYFYAAGPIDHGGWREQKILEYYLSIELLDIRSTSVVIDIASEWSIFPRVVQKMTGAKVYRQDLKYKPGIHNGRIGGSASDMRIPDQFADILVLHNSFEHFEGDSDTEFIREAWRVLKQGGVLCIVPILLSHEYCIQTDPFVRKPDIEWDPKATIVELPWWNNRFGRFYDLDSFGERVLEPGAKFKTTLYYVSNMREAHQDAYLHYALLMEKPIAAEVAVR